MIQQIAAVRRALVFVVLLTSCIAIQAQTPVTNNPPYYGPYNAVFLPDGDGLTKSLVKEDTVFQADAPWSLYAWVRMEEQPSTITLVAGVGDPGEEYPRYLAYDDAKLLLWMGKDNSLSGAAALATGKWHLIAATFDGSDFHLYSDGAQVAAGKLELGSVSPVLMMAPPMLPPPLPFSPFGPAASSGPPVSFSSAHDTSLVWQHFGGKIAGLTLLRNALSAAEIKQLNDKPQGFSLSVFEEGSKSWGVQTRGQAGYRAPQDPETMPRTKAPFSKPVAVKPPSLPVLQEIAKNQWTINGWMLKETPKVTADAAQIAQPGFSPHDWMIATVPGTVLTTMIDRGVYPDPDYGLNNLAIPESLNKQDYWYRTEFKGPKIGNGQRLTITFDGINYKADVWLNGQELGTITGAFIRGVFDVTQVMKPGQTNVLAVRISPPPHPGIPHEQSIKGGPGENGGIMCLDGPTFVATEGWDWIPAIRDRDSGLWQPVVLKATGTVKIGDAQVVTSLALPDTSKADVEITVPLENSGDAPVSGTLTASFDQTTVTKNVTVAPGGSTVKLTPAEFSQLTVQNPRLWWPNGYGKQELYTLNLTFAETGNASDAKHVRFGIREITYELSLFDETGHLRRVEFSPTTARAKGERVVNVTHAGMIETPSKDPIPAGIPEEYKEYFKWWAASIVPGQGSSAALTPGTNPEAAPYLVIKVNGVKIACRGGNWGMDDSRKRVSREKLEPYFRLHHDANLNIIRNWQGQNTEETFYDLADEYGQLIWNDFWEATENYNIEAEDPALFLKNARDVILRFRNHPSIVVWCGRNEGVPQPAINLGLDDLTRTLDGTRYYSPSSNRVNLQGSGPYRYMDPQLYYTILNRGFSVETGTPSMSTLESFKAWIPEQDQWPISDNWAYHDWHQSGNGDVTPFMAQIQSEFGAPTSLEDFERKAQMLNYVQHRAIFEGMNAHLWAPNSGRLLWMTQPAWPSTMWQIFSSDYDTQASFYGTKKACEPVHVQLDLSNNNVDVVNTTGAAQPGLTVTANVYSLDNKLLLHREETATQVIQGEKLFDLVVRMQPQFRSSAHEIGELLVGTSDGKQIPLNELATIRQGNGASFIYRESNSRYIGVQYSIEGRDLERAVRDGQNAVDKAVALPQGYRLAWGGEYGQLLEAKSQMMLIGPLALGIIFLILFALYGNFKFPVTIALGVILTEPVGALLALKLTDTPFSVSSVLGLLALLGVSVETAVILVSYINKLRQEGMDIRSATREASLLRLRPIMMTALVACLGLLPAALATGIGSDTQKPFAIVIVAGLISRLFIGFFVNPVLYQLVAREGDVLQV